MSSRAEREAQSAFRLWLRGLGLATLAHVMLPDYDQVGWLGPRLIGLIGAALLIFTPRPPPSALHRDMRHLWAMCCLTLAGVKLYTLFALRDVLTQSLLLVTLYLLGGWGLWRPKRSRLCLIAATWCVSITYGLAILHKLNADFLYTPQSCAIHGFEISLGLMEALSDTSTHLSELVEFTHQELRRSPTFCASVVLGLELSLAILCARRSPRIWLWGYLFHTPLALTIAPAFGSVMAAGWGAGSVLSRVDPRRIHRAPRPHLRASAVIWIPLLYGIHGLSPYTGLEMQHSAAMLSNLRIDPKCANSLIIPHSPYDPYLYIEEVSFGSSSLPKREQILRETIWNLAALHTMQRHWCIPEYRPLRIKGSTGGEMFLIEDLCEAHALRPLDRGSLFPSGWQRFQKNLPRRCHPACVH